MFETFHPPDIENSDSIKKAKPTTLSFGSESKDINNDRL